MSWLNPFGTVVDQVMEGDLLGTASFPSVMFEDHEKSLPKQNDNYSCGVAVIAGSAILLRDLIDPQERKVEFKSLFSIRNTQVKLIVKEYMVTIRQGYLKSLPQVGHGLDYLHMLKRELFIFFDRFATLENVTSVERYNAMASPSEKEIVWDAFKIVKEAVLEWPQMDGESSVQNNNKGGRDEDKDADDEILNVEEDSASENSDNESLRDNVTERTSNTAGAAKILMKMNKGSTQRKRNKLLHNKEAGEQVQTEKGIVRKERMKEFIAQKLKEWEWFSEEEYLAYWKGHQKTINTTTDRTERKTLIDHLKKFKADRAYFIKLLEMEFLLSSEGVLIGARYNPTSEKYILATETTIQDPKGSGNSRKVIKEVILEDETWIHEVITDKRLIQKIKDSGFKSPKGNKNKFTKYIAVPKKKGGIPVTFTNHPIVAVR